MKSGGHPMATREVRDSAQDVKLSVAHLDAWSGDATTSRLSLSPVTSYAMTP